MNGAFFLLCTFYAIVPITSGGRGVIHTCPKYVHEYAGLRCQCTFRAGRSRGKFVWVNQPPGKWLGISNVNRTMNGTQFTCVWTDGNERSTINYTLRVAYGPTNDDVSITTSRLISLTDHQPVTFTCEASNTYPTVRSDDYNWEGAECEEGGRGQFCTFDPSSLAHSASVVRCRVQSLFGWYKAFAEYVIQDEGTTLPTTEGTTLPTTLPTTEGTTLPTTEGTTISNTTGGSSTGLSKKTKLAIGLAVGVPSLVGMCGAIAWFFREFLPTFCEVFQFVAGHCQEEVEESEAEEDSEKTPPHSATLEAADHDKNSDKKNSVISQETRSSDVSFSEVIL